MNKCVRHDPDFDCVLLIGIGSIGRRKSGDLRQDRHTH